MDMNDLLRTGFDTFFAGNTFGFINFCNPILIDGDRAKFTCINTGTTADSAVTAACFSFYRPASTVTGYKGCPVWKFLFDCHNQPFLSYGVPTSGRSYLRIPSYLKYASAIAGAVGIEVISPIPIAPQATLSPGLSTTIALIFGIS